MLCLQCETVIKAAFEGNHQNEKSLQYSHPSLFQSVEEGCFICDQIWDSIMDGYSSEYVDDSELDEGFPSKSKTIEEVCNGRSSIIDLTTYNSKGHICLSLSNRPLWALDFVLIPVPINRADTGFSTEPDPVSGSASSTAQTHKLCNYWLQTCSESHTRCRKLQHDLQPFVPKRLIEISTEDNGDSFSWRVVRPASIGNVPYFTLSHCWGTSQRTRLTSKNRHEFAKWTSFSYLPKTYQHAFLVTFSLGLRFIWIDSLCIVQDDDKDWTAQASIMKSVYGGAWCNIAATWAVNGDEGLFVPKRAPTLITLDLGRGQPTTCAILPDLFYYEDLAEAPLNTRGWVVQERYLARKQLNFTRNGVYWECHELVASERCPTGIPSGFRDSFPYLRARMPTMKPSFQISDLSTLRKAWAALVDFYSECQLTRLSDKTVAIAGLAEEVRTATGDVYLAGLWKKDLTKQLCWATDPDVRRRAKRLRTPTYLAPTWSWVSVDGPVTSDQRYTLPGNYVSCAEVLDVSLHSEHISQLHSFTSSKLVLRGVALFAQAMRTGGSFDQENDDAWELHFTNLSEIDQPSIAASIEVSIMWDENLPCPEASPERWASFLNERQSHFLCMLSYIQNESNDSIVFGLILRRLPGATDGVAYVRMGTFIEYEENLIDFMRARLEISPREPIYDDIDLDDVGLAGIVHSVTVV